MQKSLALTSSAAKIARLAIPPNLNDMAAHRTPTSNLSPIFIRHSAANIVAAVPLKPAARIVGVNPSSLAPNRQRLARLHAKILQRFIVGSWRQFRLGEPVRREFIAAVVHIFAAEHTKAKHVLGR